jgi:hypothetical protein
VLPAARRQTLHGRRHRSMESGPAPCGVEADNRG